MRRRHDQHRPPSVLGDLVRKTSVEGLLQAAQSPRTDHDHGRVQLVGDVDDALPGGGGEGGLAPRRRIPSERAISAPRPATWPASAEFSSSKALPGTTGEMAARLSAGVYRRRDVEDDGVAGAEQRRCRSDRAGGAEDVVTDENRCVAHSRIVVGTVGLEASADPRIICVEPAAIA